MENLMRAAASTIGRRSFFRSLGKFGMGAAAVAGVHLLTKSASAQTCGWCDNMGGPCDLPHHPGDACGHKGTKTCQAGKPNSVDPTACHCQYA